MSWEQSNCEIPLHTYCCFSVHQSYPTLCDPMDRSTPGFPVLRYLLEFAQTHVHWVGDAIQPSHSLSSPSPPALNLSLLQSLFQWVSSSHQVAKIIQDTEHQMLERRWSNKDCRSVLVGMQSGTATVEDSLPVHMIQQLPSLLNCPKELKFLSTQKPVHTKNLFITGLFLIAKSWKQPKCFSVGEWINCGTCRQWNIIQP